MKRHHALCLSLYILLMGCVGFGSSKPTQFYVLSALSNSEASDQTSHQKRQVRIGVGPVHLPKYLDRPQVVTRTTQNRLELHEFDRWSEPMEHAISRVLRNNLSATLHSDQIVIHPLSRTTPLDYQINIIILRFECFESGLCQLATQWAIENSDNEQVKPLAQSHYEIAIESTADLSHVVQAQSALLQQFSQTLANTIETLRIPAS